MRRALTRMSQEALAQVAIRFGLGTVREIQPIVRGSSNAPKALIRTQSGDYFVKVRDRFDGFQPRLKQIHLLHQRLFDSGFAVPELLRDLETGECIVRLQGHAYEVTRFVAGASGPASLPATGAAGKMLAQFHLHASTCPPPLEPQHLTMSFHDAGSTLNACVRQICPEEACTIGDECNAPIWKKLTSSLMRMYEDAANRVNEAGFHQWPRLFAHGDWHPGNLVYSDSTTIAAVLDLDSMRFEPRITDVTNGALHYSMEKTDSQPEAWPDELNEQQLRSFCSGYECTEPNLMLSLPEIQAFPYLMIEALIAESLTPIAATGTFHGIPGLSFLNMVNRKAMWIEHNASALIQTLSV